MPRLRKLARPRFDSPALCPMPETAADTLIVLVSYGQWLQPRHHTIYSVQYSGRKIVINCSKKSLTLAFSRHIIGVVPEQKKYTGAKKEQKQKFEQKTPHKTTVPRRRSFLYVSSIGYSTNKNARRLVGHFYWWSRRVSHPRPNGN